LPSKADGSYIVKISQLFIAFFLVAMLTLAPTGAVLAHGVTLTKSDPADGAVLDQAPTQVRAWFNEEMQTGESTISVLDASGQPVDLGDGGVDLNDAYHASMLVSLPSLPDGAYTVRWHVVLLDGDPSDGEFTFYVGEKLAGEAVAASVESAPPAAPAAPEPVAATPATSGGFPAALGALGLGALIVVAGLVTVVVRYRATAESR
jgi:methionine-rich copper-binding protein CopC